MLDWLLPGLDGLAVCRCIREKHLNPILMLTAAPPEAIVRGPLYVDVAARIASLDGAPLNPTPKEFDLLLLFAAHPSRAFSRTFLLRHLWTDDYEGSDRTVDAHVTRIRIKLGAFGERIVTVWAVGYLFEP